MKYIVWDDPIPGGGNEHHRISVDEAITRAKKAASSVGYVYKNDAEALSGFLVVNLAEIEDDIK